MNARDDAYLDPYREAVHEYGAGFEATLWTNRRGQLLRFDVMRQMADFENRIILDAGCGPGDMAAWLLEQRIGFRRFIGIDGVAGQIDKANERGLDRCEFLPGDFVHDDEIFQRFVPDYICFSGTLNTMTEKVARHVVGHAYDASTHGVVFNFLSDRPDPKYLKQALGPARRFNTVRWLDWALKRTHLVAFRQDYMDGHDATILMAHPRSAGAAD